MHCRVLHIELQAQLLLLLLLLLMLSLLLLSLLSLLLLLFCCFSCYYSCCCCCVGPPLRPPFMKQMPCNSAEHLPPSPLSWSKSLVILTEKGPPRPPLFAWKITSFPTPLSPPSLLKQRKPQLQMQLSWWGNSRVQWFQGEMSQVVR